MLIIFGWLVVCLGACVWGLICDSKANRQRTIIARVIDDGPFWHINQASFEDVSYESHLFCLMTFRDPLKLYPPFLGVVLPFSCVSTLKGER